MNVLEHNQSDKREGMTNNFNNNSGIQWGGWQKTFFKHIVKEFSRSQEI